MADEKTKPIEIFCPVCGYKAKLNDPDDSWAQLDRAEKVKRFKQIQQSDTPFFTCDGCSDPKATAAIMEISLGMPERFLNQSELSRLLSKKRWPNPRSREYWFLSATLGLSESEVAGLTWRDVEANEGFVAVPDPAKGLRLIPLSPSAQSFLDEIASDRRGSADDKVFSAEPTAHEDLSAAARDCGLIKSTETLPPEILKQSFLKFLLENGKTRQELEEIYGDVPD